jgi:hypothetical protein
MKLTLNREYVLRHLGVAVLFFGLCGWFLYDGAVTYPKMDDATFSEQILHGRQGDFDKLKKEAINRQYQFAGICGIAALLIALGVGRCRLQTLAWDDVQMCGSLTGGKPLAFADVSGVDDRRWEKKGILVVYGRDGRRFTLDAWHHAGAKELVEKILGRSAA